MKNILEIVERKHISKRAITILLLIEFIFLYIKLPEKNITLKWIIISVAISVSWFVWYVGVRLPRHSKPGNGITIAIRNEKGSDEEELYNDLYDKLGKKLLSNNLKLIILPNHISKNVTNENAADYLNKTNSILMIYGHHKKREINNIKQNVLVLEGIVKHISTSENKKKIIKNDFRLALPPDWYIPEENGLLGFELTSESIKESVLYILNLGILIAGRLNEAEDGFRKLLIQDIKHPLLKGKVNHRLLNVLHNQRQLLYEQWKKDKKNLSLLEEVNIKCEEAFKIDEYDYNSNLMKAIYLVVIGNDFKLAEEYVIKNKNNRSKDWLYSFAFIKAVEGELDESYKAYRDLKNNDYHFTLKVDVEDFIIYFLENNPDKYQLYYCLGLINMWLKNDKDSAKREFEKFIEIDKEKQIFLTHQIYAEKYIKEL